MENSQKLGKLMEEIVANFRNTNAAELDKNMRDELFRRLDGLCVSYDGYITHFEIYIPGPRKFLEEMERVIKQQKNHFSDAGTLQIVARTAVKVIIARGFPDWNEVIAEFMGKLGYYSDAWELYEKAIYYYPPHKLAHGKNFIKKKMRELARAYHASGQKIPKLDRKIADEVKNVIFTARNLVIQEIFYPQQWISWDAWYAHGQKVLPWDNAMTVARQYLEEMGYSQAKRHEILCPVFQDIVKALEKNRSQEAWQGDTWWDEQIAKYNSFIKQP